MKTGGAVVCPKLSNIPKDAHQRRKRNRSHACMRSVQGAITRKVSIYAAFQPLRWCLTRDRHSPESRILLIFVSAKSGTAHLTPLVCSLSCLFKLLVELLFEFSRKHPPKNSIHLDPLSVDKLPSIYPRRKLKRPSLLEGWCTQCGVWRKH